MRRALATGALVAAATVLIAPGASATIHPIVESADCANAAADAAHPLGDVADPPGQTPGEGEHSDNSTLRAVQEAGDTPADSDHKFDGTCGHAAP